MNEGHDITDPSSGRAAVGASVTGVGVKSRWDHWTDAAAWAIISLGLVVAHHIWGIG